MGNKEQINKHGLKRRVPEPIQREIRQRCGFGCVICGLAFYDYEHFDPEFSEATAHNSEGMTLLCSQHNQSKERGRLSTETVKRANENPKCLQQGFANEFFDFHDKPISVLFSGVEFYDCQHLIVINGTPLLSVSPPDKIGEPVKLSGFLCDSQGRESISIVNNQFSVNSGTWDVDMNKNVVTFREKLRDISLQIKLDPPKGIIIERINMLFRGVRLKGNKDKLEISYNNGRSWVSFSSCSIRHGYAGIVIGNGPIAANDEYYE